MADWVVFGYVVRSPAVSRREQMAAFAVEVGKRAGIEVVVLEAKTYEELTAAMHRREVSFAWLPPIPFIALEQRDAVTPLVSLHRGGHSQFHAAIIVRTTSPIRSLSELRGKRAAWVDPYSASGYVIPRIELDALGIDPRSAFTAEKFFHSHEDVVRAVVDRTADFGATFAGLDDAGNVVRGAWLGLAETEKFVRALYTFSAIPGDVIAAHSTFSKAVQGRITAAFMALSQDPECRALLRELFAVDDCQPWWSSGYDRLRVATREASEKGILEANEHGYE